MTLTGTDLRPSHGRPRFAAVATALVALLVGGCGVGQSTTALASPTDAVLAATSLGASASASPSLTPTASPTVEPTPAGSIMIRLTRIVGGLPTPIGLSTAPGDPRLFVIGQAGQIVIVEDGRIAGTFLDISDRMSCCGERGLLGLAFHPDYASNGRFFVRYTDRAGDLRVSEFRVGSDPNRADPSSERVLLTIPHPSYGNHNGGRIDFGPDGYLYIGTGDGGSGGDPSNHGQSLKTLLGKMLRIDVDRASGAKPYAIPPSNPFATQSGALGEIFSYGLRNPYSFSFDRLTGDLWIGDVGQGQWEEVDRAPASTGGGSGVNYGWSVMEGNHCYKPTSGCDMTGLARPITEYGHGSGDSIGCAVIGGYVYRGVAHPELRGRYYFADYCSGRIWSVIAAGPTPQAPQLLLSSGLSIYGWGQDAAGELYVTASNGGLYQLV